MLVQIPKVDLELHWFRAANKRSSCQRFVLDFGPTALESLGYFFKIKVFYFCFIDYAKAFDCVDHRKLWKILREDEITRPPYLSPEKPVCRSRSNS